MDKHIYEYNELMAKTGHYLVFKLSYSTRTVDYFRYEWKKVKKFMASNGIRYYDQKAEEQIFKHVFKDRRVKDLSRNEKIFYNAVKMLTQFQQTGSIDIPARPCKDQIVFSGPIGDIITSFIYY